MVKDYDFTDVSDQELAGMIKNMRNIALSTAALHELLARNKAKTQKVLDLVTTLKERVIDLEQQLEQCSRD